MSGAIKKRLDKTYQAAQKQSIDLADLDLIIFSDQHKGQKDSADAFAPCENVYEAALKYYYEIGHHLVILGDSEELWECKPEAIMTTYASILKLESQFHQEGRYWRFAGNHDDNWYFQDEVDRHLGRFFTDLQVWDSLLLSVTRGGKEIGRIFFVHGHQGTFWSDHFAWLSRLFVRHFWRFFQRLTRLRLTTPSEDWRLRNRHDKAMYNWAVDQQGLVLIAGHTHKTVFTTDNRIDQLTHALNHLAATDPQRKEMQAELDFLTTVVQPCYFNSGCCSYPDGVITGIEISSGKIQLVRWTDNSGQLEPEVLASASLRQVFDNVRE